MGNLVEQYAQNEVNKVLGSFEIDKDTMIRIAMQFKNSMEDGLKGEKSCLKMIPSYVGKPTGKEKGTFMTMDMGGTNLRCTKFKIEDGNFEKLRQSAGAINDRSFIQIRVDCGQSGHKDNNVISEVLPNVHGNQCRKRPVYICKPIWQILYPQASQELVNRAVGRLQDNRPHYGYRHGA